MTPDPPSRVQGRLELEESFTWIRADTFDALLVGIGALLFLWILSYMTHPSDLWPGWGLPLAMLSVVVICFTLRANNYRLASALLTGGIVGCTALLLLTLDDQTLAPFLYVGAVLIAGVLHGSRAAFLVATLGSISVCILQPMTGSAIQPSVVGATLGAIWLTALTSWSTTRSLYTALHWAWANSELSVRHLEEARRYQGELAAALRQLGEANYRLERANYALGWAQSQAAEAQRLKAQFAAHVSHELRTPINLIVGFADLMLTNPETYSTSLPQEYLADLTTLRRNAKHLQGLINDILDLSQIDAGEMPVLRDLTDVGEVIGDALDTARQLLESKGLSIAIEVAPDLPLLCVDRLRLRQVLLNLLNNAARFTDRGGVTVRASHDGKDVTVTVVDTGTGITAKHLQELFEPFHQLDVTPTRSRGGTGLGLAISKRFVELHGGRIWATSEGISGSGSAFSFSLPIETHSPITWQAHWYPDDAARRWQLPTAPPDPTAVVLDDDPSIINLFQRHLNGYQVAGAAALGEAIELAKSRRAQAIITDLPDTAHLEQWHESWSRVAIASGVPVIGCPMPSGRRAARTLGLIDYLVKPVTRETLLESVSRIAPLARSILVVDDEPRMVTLLCRMLQSSSNKYVLLRAYDGDQALASMRRMRPDLVLLDILMPQVDGLAVLERMRHDEALASVPVIAVTARGAVEAITPSSARSLVLINDKVLPVSGLLSSVRAVLDLLPPAGAGEPSIVQEPSGVLPGSAASG